jgi:hypothetical protein
MITYKLFSNIICHIQDIAIVRKQKYVIDTFRRLNTTWYEYMKTVNNLRVYDPHNPEFQRLLNHLQNGEVIEASMID